MPYKIVITLTAERDLTDIHTYIAEADGVVRANAVLDRVVEAVSALERFPERGAHPPELLDLGIREYRQVVTFPYRIVYRVLGDRIFIDLIADGRRDMRALFTRHLLTPE